MDQNTLRHVAKTLRIAAHQLMASVDAKAEFKKATDAMEKAIADFKAKPTDKAYLATVESMKDFRKWAFEAYYKDAPAEASDAPAAERRQSEGDRRANDRRSAPVAASVRDTAFQTAYDKWVKTGDHRALVATVSGATTVSPGFAIQKNT